MKRICIPLFPPVYPPIPAPFPVRTSASESDLPEVFLRLGITIIESSGLKHKMP